MPSSAFRTARNSRTRHGDTLHGGVLATLLDNAAGTALQTILDDPETVRYATTEMNLSYLRPATDDLRAEAGVRRHGRSLAVIEVDIDSEREPGEWTTIAVSRASYYVDESYHQIERRKNKQKAAVATARKLLVSIHHMLDWGRSVRSTRCDSLSG